MGNKQTLNVTRQGTFTGYPLVVFGLTVGFQHQQVKLFWSNAR